ncbi:MAG: DUF481 domain-containing protein [Adhaeribacter sp.]
MKIFFAGPAGLLLTFLCLGLGNSSQAQIVNIEQGRLGRDTSNHVAGHIGLDFSLFNQNAGKNQPNNYLRLALNGDLVYHSPLHTYFFLNYLNYLLVNYTDDTQRKTVAQQGYSHLRANFYQARRLSYEVFVQGQADKPRGLEWRSLAGAYLRFRLKEDQGQDIHVFMGLGAMHEHEEWENPALEQKLEVANHVKAASYLSARYKINPNVQARATAYYQTGYSRAIGAWRNRVSGDISLGVKLNKVLAFNTSFNCTYEDRPLVPVTRFVYALSNGIQVSF